MFSHSDNKLKVMLFHQIRMPESKNPYEFKEIPPDLVFLNYHKSLLIVITWEGLKKRTDTHH